ncbi:hypothetical protein [Sagittula sp. S175]|uniref:hypothetical protein n=1 Tax=Sagittula sp. S175 TaxID=3415129 RepID=UPI003C7CE1BF
MKHFLALPLLALASPLMAGEFCTLDGTERFSCTLKNGTKAVEVCDALWLDVDTASYGFFTPGQEPEMEIAQEMTGMLYEPWGGVGTPWGSVTFNAPDDVHSYTVWYQGNDGGITVQKNGEDIAMLECDHGTLTHDLDALIERIETAQISP